MRDYTGQKVFIGIDVHKKTYSVTAVMDQQVIKKDTISVSPAGLIAYVRKYFPGAFLQSAYEAGFCGFSLHRMLSSQGVSNIVVHAASIEIASYGERKNRSTRFTENSNTIGCRAIENSAYS